MRFLPFLLLLNPRPVFFISVIAGLLLFWDAESLIVLVLMLPLRGLFLPVDDSFLAVEISLSVR